MERLPTELLLKVFSSLSVVQLLRVEDVCRRWKQMIQAEYWDRLKWITKDAIGYPDGDFPNNFIRLSRRVVQVNSFVDPFRLIAAIPENLKMEAELRHATLALARKLSDHASFPLSLIQSVILSHSKLIMRSPYAASPRTQLIVAALIEQVEYQYGLKEHQSLRRDHMSVHTEKDNPFMIKWCDFVEEMPIAILNRATRLIATSLVIPLSLYNSCIGSSQATNQPLFQLSAATTPWIDIARVHFRAKNVEENVCFEMMLELHEERRKFAFIEWLFVLNNYKQLESATRDDHVIEKIKRWFEEGRVKRSAMHVKCDLFEAFEDEYTVGQKRLVPVGVGQFSATILRRALSLVDTLRIVHDGDPSLEVTLAEGVLSARSSGVLLQLKSLTLEQSSIAHLVALEQVNGTCACSAAVTEVEYTLRMVTDCLRSLESLTLRFVPDWGHCPSSLFSVTGVAVPNGPLPRLVSLECIGLPCLPFIVSVVSQAPNLRRLSIESPPFEDDSVALQWISTLLDSVDACPRLSSLQIYSSKKKDQNGADQGLAKLNDRLAEFNAKLEALSERSQLCHVNVKVDSWKYRFFDSIGHDKKRRWEPALQRGCEGRQLAVHPLQ